MFKDTVREPPNCPEEFGTHPCTHLTTDGHVQHECIWHDIKWRTGAVAPEGAYMMDRAERRHVIALAKLRGLI